MGTNLVRKDSIEEICGHRDRAVELYARAAEILLEATQAHKKAIVGPKYAHSVPLDSLRYLDLCAGRNRAAEFREVARRVIDAQLWECLVDYTGLASAMDAEEKKRFRDSLTARDAEIPEVTPENVEATLLRFAGDAPAVFRRGLVNVWRKLSGDYKSHDGFKMGARLILGYACQGGFYWRLNRGDELRDIDRVFHLLDGKPFGTDYNFGLCGAIRASMERKETECETPYFRARWFGNGNLHLWLLREDLTQSANRLIAEELGAGIGARPEVRRRYA